MLACWTIIHEHAPKQSALHEGGLNLERPTTQAVQAQGTCDSPAAGAGAIHSVQAL